MRSLWDAEERTNRGDKRCRTLRGQLVEYKMTHRGSTWLSILAILLFAQYGPVLINAQFVERWAAGQEINGGILYDVETSGYEPYFRVHLSGFSHQHVNRLRFTWISSLKR